MKLRVPALTGPLGFSIASGIRAWMSTVRYQGVFEARNVDPALGIGGPRIYLVWHENMLAPIYLRAGCRVAILVSQHRDADLLEAIASHSSHSGYECVRGSTYRGGATALRKLVERGRDGNLVITPDGPRGPRRRLAAGPIYLASKLGMPIVPMGFGFTNPWRLSSWDRFAIPKPFSGCRVHLGSEIRLPQGIDRSEVEEARRHVESELNRVTESAEAWAAGGATPEGAERVGRRKRLELPVEQPLESPRRAA